MKIIYYKLNNRWNVPVKQILKPKLNLYMIIFSYMEMKNKENTITHTHIILCWL